MNKRQALRRQPRGVLASKPVFCRLMPEERSTLEDLSKHTGDSVSSVMRSIFLEGVGPYCEKAKRESAQQHAKPVAGR
ncbi:hypothetical protein R69746_06176 [Paraburkholderia aspalathi]|uniref:hypothetical protein n=1 Tax=Paraburkholderia aspalathi TaxID=1324617 RepID=UPI00190C50ED|nr:hypothetical protein [Paraburkholderia aspalathi]MBK3844349.1 hypothetical protein [Paraburkholderia aspalathi]CAE6823764.1 hypothetical protein R69746_06176 [Paraburkholderia aspalathi]